MGTTNVPALKAHDMVKFRWTHRFPWSVWTPNIMLVNTVKTYNILLLILTFILGRWNNMLLRMSCFLIDILILQRGKNEIMSHCYSLPKTLNVLSLILKWGGGNCNYTLSITISNMLQVMLVFRMYDIQTPRQEHDKFYFPSQDCSLFLVNSALLQGYTDLTFNFLKLIWRWTISQTPK